MIVAFAALPGTKLEVRPFAFFNMLAEIDVKAAFLRDHREAWYHHGVAGIGDDIDSVAAYLRGFAGNAEETVMIGGSSGGYGAILFGSLVGCEVHAFSPQTFIDPELRGRHGTGASRSRSTRSATATDKRYADLRPLVARSEVPVHVYYATRHPLDSLHAERLGDLENVTLHGFDWDSHLLLRELRDLGLARALPCGAGAGRAFVANLRDAMDLAELREEIIRLGPWHFDIKVAEGLTTAVSLEAPPGTYSRVVRRTSPSRTSGPSTGST